MKSSPNISKADYDDLTCRRASRHSPIGTSVRKRILNLSTHHHTSSGDISMSLTVKHLHDMTSVDVLRGLITDVANGHLYRKISQQPAHLRKTTQYSVVFLTVTLKKLHKLHLTFHSYIKNLQINSLTEVLVGNYSTFWLGRNRSIWPIPSTSE